MNKKPKVLVVGSLVMDLIVTTTRFCNAGETVIGSGFSTAAGGKGANQAVQAARLGADVTMVGMVGNDDFGKQLISSAKQSGVNTEYILTTDKAPSAIGNVQIQSNENGTENRIIVVPGGNFELTPNDTDFLKDIIKNYDIVILQNEIPTEVNLAVAKLAKANGVPVILNPAPYRELPNELISCLTYISPNEHEAADIAGVVLENGSDISKAIEKIHQMGTKNALITLGKRGCAYSDGGSLQYSNSVDCGKVLDPTAAGDSFIGAFCTAVAASLISSTGTPTYFLHGTEAVHGSCGQLSEGDIVICISNSGETAELKATALAIKNNGCKVISVTGNPDSWLGKFGEVCLTAGVKHEGGVLNRAPRASILAETYILQCLSVLLQEKSDITPEKYIKCHPGGSLGVLRDDEK